MPNDEHAIPHPVHLEEPTVNPKTGNREVRFANFHLIYPRRDAEYSFEELRAQHRGWLNIDWAATRRLQQEQATAAALMAAEETSAPQEIYPAPSEEKEETENILVHIDAEPALEVVPSPMAKENERSIGKLQIHVDTEPAPLLNAEQKKTSAKLQIHIDTEETPQSTSPAQKFQKKANKSFAVLADEEPKLQPTPLAEQEPKQEALKIKTVPLKGFEDESSLNDENMPPSQLEVDKAKATKKARREERSNRTRKIKVMEVKEIRNETQTSK